MKPYALTFLFLVFAAFGRLHAQDEKYVHKLRLVDSLADYIRNDLKLHIPDDFYKNWETNSDSMYCYLYVSHGARVEPADPRRPYTWFFASEDSARAKAKELEARGYETLLYKTAGNSAAHLNLKLITYPDEAIAFILFHEAMHIEVRRQNYSFLYNYEEALCDAFATLCCQSFAKQSTMLSAEDVENQKQIMEKVYSYVNSERVFLDEGEMANKKEFFRDNASAIEGMTTQANAFLMDRLRYPINHAYYLRMECYAQHYFEMKDMLGPQLNVRQVLETLHIWDTDKPWMPKGGPVELKLPKDQAPWGAY